MANELQLAVSLLYNKNGVRLPIDATKRVTVTGDYFTHTPQEVGTIEEELAQGADLGTPGYLYLKNLNDTYFVEVGSTTGVYAIKLKPGEIALYRHNSGTIYAKANTAACIVEYCLIED